MSIRYLRNFVLAGIIIPALSHTAVSQVINDSAVLQQEFFQEIFQNQNSIPELPVSFYLPDSIFSLRSPAGYVPSLIHNFSEQAAAAFKFRPEHWAAAGATITITGILICLDDDIDRWARTQKEDHPWVNKTFPVITELGGSKGTCVAIGFGLISAATGYEKGVRTSLLATQAMITSGLWVQLLKQLSGRERPKASYIFSGQEGGKWHGPFEKYSNKPADDKSRFSYDAFPSGHTASAFALATVIAKQYNQTRAVPVISYSVASLVAISRLFEHEHWASDVFLGAVSGFICGRQVTNHYNKTHQITPSLLQDKGLQITLFQTGYRFGLSVIW